jgi:hypothetical protein
LELTDTPDASPKYMFAGSFNGLGTESKAIVGTGCCANAGGAINSISPVSQFRMSFSRALPFSRMLVDGCFDCTCPVS